MTRLIITPKTKVYDLLEDYPQLEELLIQLAPPFKKLKNPVLRKTIAKITTISQAAIVGGLNVEELVSRLRSEIGQTGELGNTETATYNTIKPYWFNESSVVKTIDIRDILHAGEQPVHEVLSAIKHLGDGEILKVIAPFIPAPLLDKTISLKYKHWMDKRSEEEYWVYFNLKNREL